MLAHGVAGLDKMKYLLDLADLAAAMSLEAYQGSASPFKKELHEIRPFEGSQKVAERMTKLLKGSKILKITKTVIVFRILILSVVYRRCMEQAVMHGCI